MGNHILNNSFNLSESQTSSLNCCNYYYTNDIKKSGFQDGAIFNDVNAYFTSDLIGGLISFAVANDTATNSRTAMVLDVLSPNELLLDIEQSVKFADYIIWYGGIQFSQRGSLALKNLIIDGIPYGSLFKPTVLTETTETQFVPRDGVRNMFIRMVGGGGGGGGIISATNMCGGGGGSGAYIEYYGPADSFTYICGEAGLGNAGSVGGHGGSTEISNSFIIGSLTAGGGSGASNAVTTTTSARALAGNGGVAVGGTYSFNGMRGSEGLISWPGAIGFGGAGASTPLGSGGSQCGTTPDAVTHPSGNGGIGYGSGGGGAVAFQNGIASLKGGDGTQGVILVYEI